MHGWLLLLLGVAVGGCEIAPHPVAEIEPQVSSSISLGPLGELWVVNPEADSVSVIDTKLRTLVAEIALAASPAVDAAGRFDPSARPRALAHDRSARKVYVAAESANSVYVIDGVTRSVVKSIPVGAAPTAVVVHPALHRAYVVCHQAGTVVVIDTHTDEVMSRMVVGEHPWGASISGGEGRFLHVTQFLLDPGVTIIDLIDGGQTFAPVADEPLKPAGKKVPNGEARGLYSAVPRPKTGELWVPHLLLSTKTAQPALDFESTAFPTISILERDGRARRRLLFQPLDPPGQKGSFIDSVSGPRAITFTPDGTLALLALSASEDIMVFDGETGSEVSLVRPVPSTFLEGIAIDDSGSYAYVDGRNSHDVTVLRIDRARPAAPVTVDGPPIERLGRDPMPAPMRLGQRLFYTANSAAFPVTRNFWIACATCHLEGGTDAVTWLFESGPRDTPSNAGGPINTGFLFRQGLRNSVTQYDETINVEQGGKFQRTDTIQKAQLEALSAFVNFAIPMPPNPSKGAALSEAQTRGQALFEQRCASCHSGPWLTDSAAGNPTLDLAGPIVLHDIGTCVTTGANPDRPRPDADGTRMHSACDFDTPSLRGVFATAPYFHDGSARTLREVVDRLEFTRDLPSEARTDLVEFLKTL